MEILTDLFSIIDLAWHANIDINDYYKLARKFCLTATFSIILFYIGFFAYHTICYLKKGFIEEKRIKNRIWLYIISHCAFLIFSALSIITILLTIALYIALFKHLYLLIF